MIVMLMKAWKAPLELPLLTISDLYGPTSPRGLRAATYVRTLDATLEKRIGLLRARHFYPTLLVAGKHYPEKPSPIVDVYVNGEGLDEGKKNG